jgi:putative transposase
MTNLTCKYCQSENVIKFGLYKDTQYYYCKACKHKFASIETIPKMQTTTKCVADVLNMYYEGMSEAEIRRNLIQQDNSYVSTGSIYNWVKRFTDLATKEVEKHKPDVGSVWVADETVIDIDGKNVWFWDIIDTKTRYLIASHMSYTRTSKDAEELMKQAYKRTGKMPRVIYTDKLRAYLEGIERTFGAETHHALGSPFNVESNTNFIERFHGTLKSRTKVMRGLHTIDSARVFLDGWLVHYNYFRPHMSLNDKSPAQVTGIKFPFKNWKDVCEQPYEKTARIPIRKIKPVSPEIQVEILKITGEGKPFRHLKKRKAKVIPRRKRIIPSITSISRLK